MNVLIYDNDKTLLSSAMFIPCLFALQESVNGAHATKSNIELEIVIGCIFYYTYSSSPVPSSPSFPTGLPAVAERCTIYIFLK